MTLTATESCSTTVGYTVTMCTISGKADGSRWRGGGVEGVHWVTKERWKSSHH